MNDKNSCVFCKVVAGLIPASKLYEDDLVLSFLDINPMNPGHLLVIPKKHGQLISHIDEESVAQMFRAARKISIALRDSDLKCEAMNFLLADGEAAGQEVFHTHLHLIPRFQGDNFKISFKSSLSERPRREDLDKICRIIQERLEKVL